MINEQSKCYLKDRAMLYYHSVLLTAVGGWCWFVVRENCCWLTGGWCWFDVRELAEEAVRTESMSYKSGRKEYNLNEQSFLDKFKG